MRLLPHMVWFGSVSCTTAWLYFLPQKGVVWLFSDCPPKISKCRTAPSSSSRFGLVLFPVQWHVSTCCRKRWWFGCFELPPYNLQVSDCPPIKIPKCGNWTAGTPHVKKMFSFGHCPNEGGAEENGDRSIVWDIA